MVIVWRLRGNILPGCIRLRNDLCCVGWGVKLYSLAHSHPPPFCGRVGRRGVSAGAACDAVGLRGSVQLRVDIARVCACDVRGVSPAEDRRRLGRGVHVRLHHGLWCCVVLVAWPAVLPLLCLWPENAAACMLYDYVLYNRGYNISQLSLPSHGVCKWWRPLNDRRD